MSPATAVSGVVESFDEAAGLGTVIAVDGVRYRFHCTQIADGTRRIDPGAEVSFSVVPARAGIFEAAEVKTSALPSPSRPRGRAAPA